jgi:hypothetical protein
LFEPTISDFQPSNHALYNPTISLSQPILYFNNLAGVTSKTRNAIIINQQNPSEKGQAIALAFFFSERTDDRLRLSERSRRAELPGEAPATRCLSVRFGLGRRFSGPWMRGSAWQCPNSRKSFEAILRPKNRP